MSFDAFEAANERRIEMELEAEIAREDAEEAARCSECDDGVCPYCDGSCVDGDEDCGECGGSGVCPECEGGE